MHVISKTNLNNSSANNLAQSFCTHSIDWHVENLPFEDDIFMQAVAEHNRTFNVATGNQSDETLVYFYTDDLQSDMNRVKELGGRIVVERLDVIGYGALGIFLDPMGKHVAFWQPDP